MSHTVFQGFQQESHAGRLLQVAVFLKDTSQGDGVLVFDNETGGQIDLDTRGTPERFG